MKRFFWSVIRYLFYKRVFVAFNAETISKAQACAIDFNGLRLDPVCIMAYGMDMDSPFKVWAIDDLPEGQFEELKTLVAKAVQDSKVGV